MPYSASLIAYTFVEKAIKDGNPITQMKLQKLVYFAHGLHLANYEKSLIFEAFQAWQFGPVVPDIYRQYKYYKDKPIMNLDLLFFEKNKIPDVNSLDKDAQSTISTTWDALKHVNAAQLSNWTHKAGSPWEKSFIQGVSDIDIPNDEIEKYFKENILNSNATT